ncbi:MAG: exosortase-associated EpsI family protein [Phycisphaeraceae bacterium]|nr:exosortase-associated EpsI family protein [Phycisphaeraceae bacterium]
MSDTSEKKAVRPHRRHSLLTLVLMALLFAAMAWESTTRPTPEDTEPFHAQVRAAAENLPTRIGDWEGRDIPTSDEVVRLLNPNVLYQKRFTHARSGRVVLVLLVHCRDARDIYGHYPPRCYPAQGHEQLSSKQMTWHVAGRELKGMEYEFRTEGPNLVVANFIVLPATGTPDTEGAIERDMATVRRRAWEYQNRYHGAAQFQVVFRDPRIGPVQRRAIVEQMIEPHWPLIETILAGGQD